MGYRQPSCCKGIWRILRSCRAKTLSNYPNSWYYWCFSKGKKVMQLFRLRQIHNATFVRLNEATVRMLRLIEPYVTYGYPTRATIEKLVYKRGFGKLNKQRVPIAENSIIEQGLGKFGICCTADLVHELVTVGPNFKAANNFLWPFKLSSPLGGFSRKTKLLHFMEGGEAGARGEEINKLVKKML